MKKNLLGLFLGLFLVSNLLQSCGGSGSTTSTPILIPEDATIVVCMNLNSIIKKAPNWKDISKQMAGSSKISGELMEKVLESGINLKSKLFMFGKLDKNSENNYTAFAFSIGSTSKFESTIKKKDGVKIEKDKDVKYVVLDESGILLWKNNSALLVIAPDLGDAKLLKKNAKRIINNKKPLKGKNGSYDKVIAKNADIAFWLDTEQITKLSEADYTRDLLENSGLKSFYDELDGASDYAFGTVNFEKGKAVMEVEQALKKDKVGTYKKFFDKDGINASLASKIPLKTPMITMGFAINLSHIFNLLKDADALQGSNDEMKDNFGVTKEEFFNIFSGECVIGLDELNGIDPSSIGAAAGFGLKDKEALKKILEKLADKKVIIKEEDHYIAEIKEDRFNMDVFIVPHKDMLFLASKKRMKNSILANKQVIDSKISKGLGSNILLVNLDFQAMAKANPLLTSFSIFKELKTMQLVSKGISGNIMKSSGELVLKNTSENSLTVLLKVIKDSQQQLMGAGAFL